MLPAANRLKGDSNFQRLRRRSRPFFSQDLTVRTVANQEPESRFGFVVSTKVSKKAVDRNKITRRLREVVRLELPNLIKGYDVLIIVKKSARALDYEALREQVTKLFTKAHLYLKK